MKKKVSSLCLIILGFVVMSVALRYSAVARATPAVPAVYDTKNMPGSACVPHGCSATMTLDRLYNVEATGVDSLGIAWGPQAGPTDTCGYICPIIRDRIQDGVGVRGAWIEIQVNSVSSSPGGRNIYCTLSETTGTFMLNGSLTREISPNSPTVLTLTPTSHGTQRIDLPIPYPNVPQTAWAHGATYANGYSSIDCTIPWGTRIEGYSWTEYAGESTDW